MAIQQFEPGRSIEIMSPSYGSGYRLGGRLVLTAAHLVAEVGAACRVRSKQPLQSFSEVQAKVAWKAQGWDIALIELPEDIDPCEAVVLGRLPQSSAGETIGFQMYGYPRWARTQREGDKTAAGGRQIEGVIYLADTSPDGLLVLEAQRLPPEGASSSNSDWSGASGGAVVCGGCVVAVQSQHQNPQRPASLEAASLVRVEDDEQWRKVLQQYGIRPELQLVQLDDRLSPTIPAPYFYPRDLGSSTFVGREAELKQLHERLETTSQVGIVAATGMGGIGKTELAWQYVHQYQSHYPAGIWWMSAATVVGEVLTYGIRMQLPPAPDHLETDAARVQWYYDRWLEAVPQGKRLLVWDDVSDYTKVRSLLPQDGRYRVLLTTRAKLGSPVQRLELGVLQPEAALELLRRRIGSDPALTVAVGDGRNDIEMLEWAARGVAMGQAPEEVRSAATEVTGSVYDDGAAKVLRSLV